MAEAQGGLVVTRTQDSLSVSRAPTAWDRLALALPAVFCGLAAVAGVALSARLGVRFIFVVFAGLLGAALFVFLQLRRRAVRVEGSSLVLPRAFRGLRIPAAQVLGFAGIAGGEAHEAGVRVTHIAGEEVVLYGLSEKDRARAAHLLRDALNESLSCEESVRRCPALAEGLQIPEHV